MHPDIIGVGYKPGVHLSVICNSKGFKQLPEPMDYYTDGGGNMPIGARIPMTQANIVALRMMGVLSEIDLPPIMNSFLSTKPKD